MPGYFPDGYWVEYWDDKYWPDYGEAVITWYQYLHTRFRTAATFEAEFHTTVNYNTRFRASPSFEAEFH